MKKIIHHINPNTESIITYCRQEVASHLIIDFPEHSNMNAFEMTLVKEVKEILSDKSIQRDLKCDKIELCFGINCYIVL